MSIRAVDAERMRAEGVPSAPPRSVPAPAPVTLPKATTSSGVVLRRLGVAGVCAAGVAAAVLFFMRPSRAVYATVTRGTAVRAVYASGVIEPVVRVEIKARTAGPIAEMLVREGDAVVAGQPLLRIEAPQLGFDVARGRADLGAAESRLLTAPQVHSLQAQKRGLEAELRHARADLERVERLASASAVTDVDVDRARLQVDGLREQITAVDAQQGEARIVMRADAARQRAIVESLASRARDAELHAPIGGTVLARHAEPGEVVSVNQPLLKIGDLSRLHVEAQVDEADVSRVREGLPAVVRLGGLDEEAFPGHVERVFPDAERERKSYAVHISFDHVPGAARSGMSAEVNVVLERHEGALLVPLGAVSDGSVWVIDDGDRVRRRPVVVGIRDLATLEVVGVAEGDRVVVAPESLRDGERVKAERAPPPKPQRQKGPAPAVQ
jgi:multidrug efflux pump subunit AcrA (membrane-fusion protein)